MRRAPGSVLLEVDQPCSLVSSLLSGAVPAPSFRAFSLEPAPHHRLPEVPGYVGHLGIAPWGTECTNHTLHWSTEKGIAAFW